MKRILVTGSYGQIGTELIDALRKKYGGENVIATGRKKPPEIVTKGGPYYRLDALDMNDLQDKLVDYDINVVIHNVSILSGVGEQNPQLAWETNVQSAYNVLEAGRILGLSQVMIPSSIAAFGPSTPRENTPNDVIMRPTTMYGITKVTIELLGEYYTRKFNLDFRSLRYPGIISSEALPGGGTTDYAVAIFYDAIKNKRFTSFLSKDTRLPMMYMPDCIKSTIDLIEADAKKLIHRTFNVAAVSFTPEELANEIKKIIPDFQIDYKPDFHQAIADSWPKSIDDSVARKEWGWKPEYDLPTMTKDMIKKLKGKLSAPGK
jgi:nucleoside-diphosphate-sugar epimerase